MWSCAYMVMCVHVFMCMCVSQRATLDVIPGHHLPAPSPFLSGKLFHIGLKLTKLVRVSDRLEPNSTSPELELQAPATVPNF